MQTIIYGLTTWDARGKSPKLNSVQTFNGESLSAIHQTMSALHAKESVQELQRLQSDWLTKI